MEITDAVMRGVVSIPHGWGHDLDGVEMSVASEHAGSNSNLLADETPGRPAVGQRRPQRDPGRARPRAGGRARTRLIRRAP